MVDPETELPIYIGITTDLRARRSQHYSDGTSAVRQWMAETSRKPFMVTIGFFYTEKQALAAESTLIALVPGLVNKARISKRKLRERLFDWQFVEAA